MLQSINIQLSYFFSNCHFDEVLHFAFPLVGYVTENNLVAKFLYSKVKLNHVVYFKTKGD